MSHNDPRNDPYSGYRPDLDLHPKEVNEEVDQAFRMLGYMLLGLMAFVVILILAAIFKLVF